MIENYDHKIPVTFYHKEITCEWKLENFGEKKYVQKKRVLWVESSIIIAGKQLSCPCIFRWVLLFTLWSCYSGNLLLGILFFKKASAKDACFCRVGSGNLFLLVIFYAFKPICLGAFNISMYHCFYLHMLMSILLDLFSACTCAW